jgi:transposase
VCSSDSSPDARLARLSVNECRSVKGRTPNPSPHCPFLTELGFIWWAAVEGGHIIHDTGEARRYDLGVADTQKRRALQAQGALNSTPEKVRADPFRTHPEFFDADDRLQVRSELLRGPAKGEMSVVEACRLFGVSRQTFYTLKRALDARGLAGLAEGKRGRKGPLKASLEIVTFVRDAKEKDSALSGSELASRVKEHFGVQLHRRTVERLLVPKSGDTSTRAGTTRSALGGAL